MGRVSRGAPSLDIGREDGINCKAEETTKGFTKSYSCQAKRHGQEKEEKRWKKEKK